jgi:hypothetical protein
LAPLPLPLAGNTEGPEEDNGEYDDECNDNNDNEEDGNNGDGGR